MLVFETRRLVLYIIFKIQNQRSSSKKKFTGKNNLFVFFKKLVALLFTAESGLLTTPIDVSIT